MAGRPILLLLLFFIVAGPARAERLSCKVVGIADGDTLTALCRKNERIKVRLAQIDAPEMGQPFGRVARNKLSELCFGKTVGIVTSAKDRYGRTVGQVTCNGVDVNAEMVRSGLAWAYTGYVVDSAFFRYQDEAKRNKRGLWSARNPVPPWQWRRTQKNKRGASGILPDENPLMTAAGENRLVALPSRRQGFDNRIFVTEME